MPDQYPFIVSNNKIEPVLKRIRSAAKPERLSQELLATWGFTASNDRAMPRVLKALGFLNDNGSPTPNYDRLRDPADWKFALAESIRQAYSELFAMDANIQNAPEPEVRGAISRITGKDEETVKRYYATFKTLCGLADFNNAGRDGQTAPTSKSKPPATEDTSIKEKAAPTTTVVPTAPNIPQAPRQSEYHYNIQIHLPVTTDITVYNAIFKSLRENLGV